MNVARVVKKARWTVEGVIEIMNVARVVKKARWTVEGICENCESLLSLCLFTLCFVFLLQVNYKGDISSLTLIIIAKA